MYAAFKAEGNMLAAGDGYAAITIWDIDTEQLINTFKTNQVKDFTLLITN